MNIQNTLSLNYDHRYDILYVTCPNYADSYTKEDDNGIVTYFSFHNDKTTGMAIYDFKERLVTGKLESIKLPIAINIHDPAIGHLIFEPKAEYRGTMPC